MDRLTEDSCRLYLGTRDGLRVARLDGDGLEIRASGIADNVVRAIAVHPADPDDVFVGCGLRGWGLYRTTDGGDTVDPLGFEDVWVWGVARHPTDPETVYVGTEPPMVHVSTDDGATFEACEAIDDLPSRPDWTFFHAPFRAGHVHGFALHPDRPDRVVAGVEHGALVVSRDGGATWSESLVGSDVHRVAVHPTDPDRVFAATGSGMHRSDDAGDSWEPLPALEGRYLHAVVFDPRDPDRMYTYAAEGESPVHRSDDGGESWRPVAEGLPAARPADTLRLHPVDPDTLVYAGDTGSDTSHLFVSPDRGGTWARLERSLPKVWRLAVADVRDWDG